MRTVHTEHTDRARSSFEAAGIAVEFFADVLCEPTISSWLAAVDHAASGTFDGFIAVGGGSTIDTAKAVRLLSAYPADPLSYIDQPIGADDSVPGPLKPLIAVPTTANSSETSARVDIQLTEGKIKATISDRHLRPSRSAESQPAQTSDLLVLM
jgi:hydroxyacid-oxoacid transhydrogenase